MKRPTLLSTSILIASAILLSAANAEKPSPRPTPKPSESAAFSDQQRGLQPTPIGTPNLSHAPNRASAAGRNNQGSDISTIVIAISAVVSTVSTALIAWFNWQLVGLTDEMKKATADAAKAAEGTLHLNRPAIVVTYVDPQIGAYRGRANTLIGYSPQIYNLGSGPAEIVGVFAHTQVFDSLREKGDTPFAPAEEPRATGFDLGCGIGSLGICADLPRPQRNSRQLSCGLFPRGQLDRRRHRSSRERRKTACGLWADSVLQQRQRIFDSILLLVGPCSSCFSQSGTARTE